MVATRYGKIEGVDQGNYITYFGVPYARPPIGDLRWRAPKELEPWEGVYRADDFRNKCMQEEFLSPPYDKDFYSQPEYNRPMSEDCLYLHMWVPKKEEGALGDQKFPVAFWIHGGAYMGGYSSEMEFDGKAYCERGVILVSVEYRCNLFGFLAHPWLTAENELHISGNYGILDQIAALKWVYENIEAFGGDREQITVFGQSAGAMSVQTLVSSRLTEHMIAGAVMQSGGSYGGGLHRDMKLAELESYGEIFADIIHADSLVELRSKTAEEIMAAAGEFMEKVLPQAGGLFLVPVIDGYVLDCGYYEAVDQGKIRDIPYILGSTKNDILVTPKMMQKGEFSDLYKGCTAFSYKLEELGQKPAYVYYFTRDLPGDDLGAWHSSELWYMFGTMDRCWRPWEESDHALSAQMLDYWTHFMKTGNPNGSERPVWKPCKKEEPFIMQLG